MTRSSLFLTGLVLLAACGTPQEQCINRATVEVRKLDRMIGETEGNLARGYAYEEREVIHHEWLPCLQPGPPGQPPMRTMCFEPVEDTIRREVPIDPAAEARKLAGLKAKRADLAKEAQAQILICRKTYPE